MKKIMQLGIAAILVLGLSGCGSKVSEEAIDRYVEVSKNSTNMKSADYNMNVKITIDKETLQLNAYGSYDANSDLNLNMALEMEGLGSTKTNVGNVYIEDGDIYLDFLGDKQVLSFDTYIPMVEYLVKNSNQEIDKEQVKKMLKEAKLKDNHLILTLDKEVYKDLIDENLKKSQAEGITITPSDITMDITMEEEYMSNMIMDFVLTTDVKGQSSQKMQFHMAIGMTNINTEKNIPAPQLDEYPEGTDLQDLL